MEISRPMGSFAVQLEECFIKIPKSTNSSSFPVYEISTTKSYLLKCILYFVVFAKWLMRIIICWQPTYDKYFNPTYWIQIYSIITYSKLAFHI